MPQDFERSEQVVVTGTRKGGYICRNRNFDQCPSKYKDEEIYIRADN